MKNFKIDDVEIKRTEKCNDLEIRLHVKKKSKVDWQTRNCKTGRYIKIPNVWYTYCVSQKHYDLLSEEKILMCYGHLRWTSDNRLIEIMTN